MICALLQVPENRKMKQYRPRYETRMKDYKILFRFDEKNVEWMASYFIGNNNEHRGGGLSPKYKNDDFSALLG